MAAVHRICMTTITNFKHRTSKQHIELGASRSKRDFYDLTKIRDWFHQHEPFNLNKKRLRSLSSGLATFNGDGVNSDKTEQIGAKIHEQLNQINFTEATIKRSHQVRSLDHLLVASALQFASQGNATTVVADDMDVLILLMYHWHTLQLFQRSFRDHSHACMIR